MKYLICIGHPGIVNVGSESAVDTLEEAIAAVRTEVCDFHGGTGPDDEFAQAALDLTESGGVIGPLADGFVIEVTPVTYRSQSARDAQRMGYGKESYWEYLDQAAQEHHDYYMRHGDPEKAAWMLTRSLGESLAGNDGI